MSTSYAPLSPLFSSIRHRNTGGHDEITIFQKGRNIGTLCVGRGEGHALLTVFFCENDTVATRYCKGAGVMGVIFNRELPDETQLLSETGELTTVGELKKLEK